MGAMDKKTIVGGVEMNVLASMTTVENGTPLEKSKISSMDEGVMLEEEEEMSFATFEEEKKRLVFGWIGSVLFFIIDCAVAFIKIVITVSFVILCYLYFFHTTVMMMSEEPPQHE